MLGKNSSQKRWQNMARQDHFAIRKLSIGAVSILLGVAFLASGQTVKADTITPNTDSSNIQKTKLTTYSDLNSFLKRNDDVKTSKDNKNDLATESASNHTSAAKESPAHTVQTQADHIHQGKWNNINVTYDDETKELTLLGGTENAPAIMQNGNNLKSLSDFLPELSSSSDTLKKITIPSKIKAQGSASGLFSRLGGLTSVEGLVNLDTSEITDMSSMFNGCERLTSLDVSNFNTSKVTDMSQMFWECRQLASLDVSGFDTSSVTNMTGMFYNCWNLTNLDVSKFDTSKTIDISGMFYWCHKLTRLDVSNFKTSQVIKMDAMFVACFNLTSLDVSKFDTSKITDMSGMFQGCTKLAALDVSNFDTSKVTNMQVMFQDCDSLTSLDLSRFDTSKVTNMWGMIKCPKLRWLSLGTKFKFLQENGLKNLPGKWINLGVANQQLPKGTKRWTSNEFTENYNGATDYDTYVRFINFGGPITAQYRDQNGNKIPNIADEQQYGNVGDSLIDKTNPNSLLSFKRKDISGYNFDHAEIDGRKVDLTNIKYTENPQTLKLFYVKANSDNNGSNSSNGSDNTNDSNESNSQNNSNNSSSIKIPIEFSSNVTLRHNAYLYDNNGKRANSVTFKAGSIITVYGNKNINGRKFYILIDENNKKKYYVAAGNVKPVNRKLKHNAYVYNKYGKRIKKTSVYKKRHYLNTFGDPVTIRGHRYFIIDNERFVKAGNFALKHPTKKVAINVNNSGNKTIMHNAYLYSNQGKRANKIIISAGSRINTLNSVKINNRLYYKLEDDFYIAAGNINASKRKLKHNAYIYSQYGNRIGEKVLKKRKFVKTYGYAVSIKHKKYYITAKNKFVKKANFR